jgi:hypothetical protein
MITRQEAAELMYAGVLGCLDRADQTKLNEYLKAGGELPSNLGEFQNIAAMLPIVLQAENPDSGLKDKVARKLYRIKDEIRAKASEDNNDISQAEIFYGNSRENRKSSSTSGDKLSTSSEPEKLKITENEPETESVEEPRASIEPVEVKEAAEEQNSREINAEDFEPVTPSRNTFESFKSTREKVLEGNFEEVPEEKQEEEVKPESRIPTRDKIRTYDRVVTKERPANKTSTRETPYMKTSTRERGKSFEKAYKKRYVTEETSSKNRGMAFWMTISLFTILLLALLVFYLNFSSEIKHLQFTNDTLKEQVNDLSVKFNSTQEIQNILESADVNVVNLDGTGINPVGKGKLIISITQSKGYLQLSDMPELGRNSAYQLWMQMPDGRYFSLGVFSPSGRVQYFPFKIPQSQENNITEFLVTEETSNGAAQPGNKVFLTGSIR